MAFKFNPFTGNLDLVKDTPPAGNNTEIQFNDNGAFGSSANLTFDGTFKVKGAGATSATRTLALTNSSDVNLFTMRDDGTFAGKNLAIGEYTGATRIGEDAGLSGTGLNWTAIGRNAGLSNTTGANWTAIGYRAGESNSIGDSWAAIGYQAGLSNTNGGSWTSIGGFSAFNNTTGSFWTAIGSGAGYSNTTGSSWTSIGTNAGRENISGGFWTAIGNRAGYNNTTGSSWIAMGSDAARYISGTTTNLEYFQNSIYIGSLTKGTNGTSTALTNNETVIGYQAEGNGSNTVTIGSSAVTANYFRGSLNTKGQGTTSATNTLALTNSSDENLLTMRDDGTFSGKNLAVGEYTGAMRIGEDAGVSATGANWTAIGVSAGYNNTEGSFWTAIGTAAGRDNTTGNSWTAIGLNAGLSSTEGSAWTAIGNAAGRNNTTGSSWVAIGQNAGRYISGTTINLEYFENSTYIGTGTKGTNGTSSVLTENETVIGYNAEGNGSNTVTIGSSAVTDNYFNGDIHAQGNGKGILVTSPDGLTTKRIGIDNSGNLVITNP